MNRASPSGSPLGSPDSPARCRPYGLSAGCQPDMPSIEELPAQNGTATQPMTPINNPDDLALLAKLEEANRALESDQKSLQSLSVTSKHSNKSGHSRQGSVSSMLSNASISSSASNLQDDDSTSPDDLWSRWGKIAGDWDNISKRKPNYIKELVRKGIPHHFRGIVWQLLCTAHDSPAKEQYAEYLKMTSPCEKVIRRDITRTYPEHDFFKEKDGLGQESLFNVMKAFSLHDREVGYCQGSGFIVGLLLMQMPEEEAFAVLVRIMQEYRLRELFKPSMAELGLCMFQLECMIQEHLPQLYSHFQAQNFCVSMFASSWFLTLFATTLPLPIACRIFDIFVSEGMEMIFRVGFAILQLSLDELLTMDMEGMIKFLQKEMPAIVDKDPETLFQTAFQVKYNAKRMKKLEKEYNALKSKEQEEQVELRRLRTENRLLRQRIENLEKETATLADRLIQDQVKYAQQEEEVYVLRRECSVARQHSHQASQKLGEVTAEYQKLQTQKSNSNSSNTSLEGVEEEESKDKQIAELQHQVAALKVKAADDHDVIRELRDKNKELENTNRQVQNEPCVEIQSLQEELIACKLREAEASLSLKELQQKVHDLNRHWQKHLERQSNPQAGNTKSTKNKVEVLQEDLIGIRMREASVIAELKEMKQRVMELETQNHICDRQIKRLENENDRLREEAEQAKHNEKDYQNQIREFERHAADVESKKKEESMMGRIKDAEHSQCVAEMRQRIAELEIENQELVTAGQLQVKGDKEDLENRVTELQDEILQLKMARRLHGLSSLALNNIHIDTESDCDTDEMESTLSSTRLSLTDSMMALAPNRLRPNTLDSSDGEVLDRDQQTKRKHSKKKRKSSSGGKSHKETDFDKTPTQELFNSESYFRTGNGVSGTESGTESSVKSSAANSVKSSTADSIEDSEINTTNGVGQTEKPQVLDLDAAVEDAETITQLNGSKESAITTGSVE